MLSWIAKPASVSRLDLWKKVHFLLRLRQSFNESDESQVNTILEGIVDVMEIVKNVSPKHYTNTEEFKEYLKNYPFEEIPAEPEMAKSAGINVSLVAGGVPPTHKLKGLHHQKCSGSHPYTWFKEPPRRSTTT